MQIVYCIIHCYRQLAGCMYVIRYGPSFGPYLARTHKYRLIAQMVQEFLC